MATHLPDLSLPGRAGGMWATPAGWCFPNEAQAFFVLFFFRDLFPNKYLSSLALLGKRTQEVNRRRNTKSQEE